MTTKNRKREAVTKGGLAYQRARTQLRMHSMLLEAFARSGLRQADLARMTGRKPEVVNRVLGEATNYKLDTLSDFLFVLCDAELSDVPAKIERKADPGLPSWLKPQPTVTVRQDGADSDAFTMLMKA